MNPTLTRLLNRLLREDTIELILAPTIADLEFERAAATRRSGRMRGYVALCRAVLGAVAWDGERTFSAGTAAVRESDPRSIMTAGAAFAAYFAAATLFIVDIRAGAQQLNESAVISDPVLRSIAASAVGMLLVVILCRAVLALSRVRRRNVVAQALLGTAVIIATTQAAAGQAHRLLLA